MARALKVSIGQASDKGRKEINQDFHGAMLPEGRQLQSKGVAIVIADGVSSSEVSQIAAESAVKGFLLDYYCTSDSWTVKTSARRVIAALNSWLYAQTRANGFRYDRDRGYVCTFSALIVKSASAHIFHIGDSRVYRARGARLEQLTQDHRVRVSSRESYLGRALGIGDQVEIEYSTVPVVAGDIFLLATDGVYEFVSPAAVLEIIATNAGDLDKAARCLIEAALANGGDDNLTAQIARVDEAPDGDLDEFVATAETLPLPPLLEARATIDKYTIVRTLHASDRSHVYLATDRETGAPVALKAPSTARRDDIAYLRRFLMEEWIARRIDSPHVLKARAPDGPRAFLYIAYEFIEGQTLAQWMLENPRPDLETVIGLVEQIGLGLRAFHRREMIHQDLRPQNILIDKTGVVKIIDFGSVHVAGVDEAVSLPASAEMLGTPQYAAPEYFLGEQGTARSDIFSLGVIAYQMLTGDLPYGAEVARAGTRALQRKLRYRPAARDDRHIPPGIDRVLARATSIAPAERHEEVSEFLFELRNPRASVGGSLLEKNPLLFWKLLCLILAALLVIAIAWR